MASTRGSSRKTLAKRSTKKAKKPGRSAPKAKKTAKAAKTKSKARKAGTSAKTKPAKSARAGAKRVKKTPARRKKVAKSGASASARPRWRGPARNKPKKRASTRSDSTKLSASDLRYFRNLLLIRRGELTGDLDAMQQEALSRNSNDASGYLSSLPDHMADVGSDAYEQEFTLGLIQNERVVLREIDEALERIQKGTYGICVATGKPIGRSRLEAKPWARYCIEYARQLEKGLVEPEIVEQ